MGWVDKNPKKWYYIQPVELGSRLDQPFTYGVEMSQNKNSLGLSHFICGVLGMLFGVFLTLVILDSIGMDEHINENIRHTEAGLQEIRTKLNQEPEEERAQQALRIAARDVEKEICDIGGFLKIRDPSQDPSINSQEICEIPYTKAFVFRKTESRLEFIPTTTR